MVKEKGGVVQISQAASICLSLSTENRQPGDPTETGLTTSAVVKKVLPECLALVQDTCMGAVRWQICILQEEIF